MNKIGLVIKPDVATEAVRIIARGRRLDGFGNAGAVEVHREHTHTYMYNIYMLIYMNMIP